MMGGPANPTIAVASNHDGKFTLTFTGDASPSTDPSPKLLACTTTRASLPGASTVGKLLADSFHHADSDANAGETPTTPARQTTPTTRSINRLHMSYFLPLRLDLPTLLAFLFLTQRFFFFT